MKTQQIIKQLLNGNHLSDSELKEAQIVVSKLQNEIDSRKPYKIEFTRANNDINGNPRYICHFLAISNNYDKAVELANSIGGRKHNTKSYGGGLIFSTYNTDNLKSQLLELKEN